ncbi:HAD-IC family P-type ATPase [Dactylosporangium aurantiacum]|uniref:HAD-IC family P-type ATPase n=1 Tax=Dactylosporangium aurantiacum TaxID=35754 RepID=A0A9Q9IM59_9ACTN|nr:HAD-IC family P-type ATPase [Dactylosporangium aurantiacum]MDG6106299.1 HAD-IC family P-type ATPase [Dactylosporangium aurantiacum]UWZ58206.1 HAD-IC family P-type ATPase [Dactylosporangium aurantiacum]
MTPAPTRPTPAGRASTRRLRGGRKAWARDGLAHIQVGDAEHHPIGAERGELLEKALQTLRGVDWAAWNAALGRLLISYDEDELGLDDLIESVTAAEADQVPAGPPTLDTETRHLTTLIVDLLSAAGGLTARGLRLPAAPRELAALVALVDHIPGLRARLRGAVGRNWADLAVSAASAGIDAAGQVWLTALADAAMRIVLLREATAQRAAWQRRATELPREPGASRADRLDGGRPAAPADGPIEQYSRRVSTLALLASGAAALMPRGVRRAARVLAAGSPVPAYAGREAYAGELGRLLARRDVLVRDPAALRRLDRVDTVVVDVRALTGGRHVITHLEPVNGTEEAAWQAANRLVDGHRGTVPAGEDAEGWALVPPQRLTTAPPDAVLDAVRSTDGTAGKVYALTRDRQPVAAVVVEPALDPLTSALIAAGRQVGRVLLAGAPAGLRRRVPADGTVPGGSRLAASIRALQRDGHVVVLIGERDDAALAAADCGYGVLRPDRRPPWGAHLMGGPGLETAWLLLEAATVAKAVSKRSVLVAAQGSVAGALLGITEGAERGARHATLATGVALAANVAGAVWSARGLGRRAVPVPAADVAWHALPVQEVTRILETSPDGISEEAAARRRRADTPDETTPGIRGLLGTVVGELNTPLTLPLAAGAGVSAMIGAKSDAALVGAVILANALISGIQDVAARRALRRLVNAATPRVRLRRAGVERASGIDELVPGDVVLLEPGDVVPADCRLIDTSGLEIDESSLTGESMPVTKRVAATRAAAVAERTSMVYAGTTVAAGTATCVVVATGERTEAGRSALVALQEAPKSGVQRRLRELTRASVPAAGAAAAALFTAGLLRGRLSESINSSVALAVAAIPEGLPFIATAAELSASRRLSERNILVRDPRSMEALGRVDVICFDKTGTLTEGQIALRTLSDGRVQAPIDRLAPAHRLILAAALRASPVPNGQGTLPHPTDQAVVDGAAAAGVSTDEPARGWRPVRELPFEPARGFHAVLGTARHGQVLSVKGAPEITLPRCVTWRPDGTAREITPADRHEIEAEVDRMARQGLRVLAIAERAASARRRLDDERVDNLEFLGLLGLADPTRPTAAEAVDRLRRAGIKVIMLTGDHPSTAAAIAAELDLLDGGTVATGPDLDDADDATVDALVAKASVFARVSPGHKAAVVRALRRAGHAVAVTGDGANDAPAIRLADVGIALGEQATAAARESADMIVMDGRIETIAEGVVEGRAMWTSVRESLALLLGGNLGEILFTVGSSLLAATPPLNARQILFVNLMTDLLPAITVAARPPKHVTVERLIREGPEASLGETLIVDVARRAVATSAATTAAWLAARATGTATRASTVALASLVGAQLGQTALASGGDPVVLGAAGASAAALAGVVQTPGLSQFFGCRPMGPVGWGIVLAATTAGTAMGALRLPRRLLPGTTGR